LEYTSQVGPGEVLMNFWASATFVNLHHTNTTYLYHKKEIIR